jgi:hypothetical protein
MENQILFYRGSKGYKEIVRDEKLSRPGRIIRVYNYAAAAGNEKLYVIGTQGRLFDSDTRKEVEPKKVLSRRSAPDGWSVEGFGNIQIKEFFPNEFSLWFKNIKLRLFSTKSEEVIKRLDDAKKDVDIKITWLPKEVYMPIVWVIFGDNVLIIIYEPE